MLEQFVAPKVVEHVLEEDVPREKEEEKNAAKHPFLERTRREKRILRTPLVYSKIMSTSITH